jgi:glycosyltransferase involved in cell wall biosynthesis/serine acetyltransferase
MADQQLVNRKHRRGGGDHSVTIEMLKPIPYYRLARWLYLRGIPFIPRILQRLSVLLFHCYIPYTAEIGDGFEVAYWGMGVVIHSRAKIGNHVFIGHGVTIGGRNQTGEAPTIEDCVFVATGAKVLGGVTIGTGSVIGANAVVIKSIPARCIAVGVPARVSRENINIHDYTGWPKFMDSAKASSPDSNSPAISISGLRILHMVNSLDMGGSEHQMVEVARRQKLKGYRVTVACLSARGPLLEILQQAGITVAEFNPRGGFLRPRGLYQLLRLTRLLRHERLDVFQAHELYSTLLGTPAAWLARVPVILSARRNLAHWWWYTPRRRKVLRWVHERSTFVIANSQAVCDDLIEEDRVNPNLVRVVRNAVDVQKFANVQPDRETLFPKLSPEDMLIVAVANMNTESKGYTDLIHAASEVCRHFPQARFLLVGDGRERSKLEGMARGANLSENILFLGKRTDVPRILPCGDLFVSSSWSEGLPNSVLEAMAAGLPVVATRVGGTPEVIEDGLSGVLVAPRDSSALANGILRVLRDKDFAQALARGGRERVKTAFGFDRLLTDLDRVYSDGRQNNASQG